MDFTINRDKNYINFLANGKKKPYVFDINTGILYSLQSKPLKNLPPKMKNCLYECKTNDMVFALMHQMMNIPYYYGDNWNFNLSLFATHAELFKVADKLNSLGYKYKNASDINMSNLTVISEHFKVFVKYFNEDNNTRVSHFVENIYPHIWAKEHNIEINEVFTLDFVKQLLNSSFTTEQIDYIVRCVCRGVGYYFMRNDIERIDYWSMLDKFKTYFGMCKKMNLAYEKDFFRGYINATRMYQVYKLHIDNEAIIDNYKNRNFCFEDENFVVVVPQTVEDFRDEAVQQDNCVYSCYMRDVVNHKTNVVFIRKKDNVEKSYITCEISNNGNIRQYLLAYNQRVEANTPEREFYYKYAEWLKENWV